MGKPTIVPPGRMVVESAATGVGARGAVHAIVLVHESGRRFRVTRAADGRTLPKPGEPYGVAVGLDEVEEETR